MLNLRDVSQHIDGWWQILFSRFREFVVRHTNRIFFKTKNFSSFFFFFFFCHFWNRHQILNILKKKMIVIAPSLRKLQAVKDLVRLLPKKQYFTKPFDSQHVKESQSLVKSAWDHIDEIFSSLWENMTWKISPLVIC